MRQLPALLRQHRPDLMAAESLYRSPAGYTSWSAHWAKAVMVELALEHSESNHDHVGIWGGMAARQRGSTPSRVVAAAVISALIGVIIIILKTWH